jgi:hypothetical protein
MRTLQLLALAACTFGLASSSSAPTTSQSLRALEIETSVIINGPVCSLEIYQPNEVDPVYVDLTPEDNTYSAQVGISELFFDDACPECKLVLKSKTKCNKPISKTYTFGYNQTGSVKVSNALSKKSTAYVVSCSFKK